MKSTKSFVVAVAAMALAASVPKLMAADTGKEMTLTGKIVCGKCVLHETRQCMNVLLVPENGTTNEYYLAQNGVSKAFHKQICTTSGEQTTVTGTVAKKRGKEILTPTKIEPVK